MTNACFVCFYNRNQIYLQLREDGTFGFPGGKAEPEDGSLFNTANRECQEEAGRSIPLEGTEYFCAHQVRPDLTVHLFTRQVTASELDSLVRGTLMASHAEESLGGGVFTVNDAFKSHVRSGRIPMIRGVVLEMEELFSKVFK